MGRLIRGVSKNARFFIVDTTDIVREAQAKHDFSPTGISALGRALTGAVIMGSDLKVDGSLSLRFDGNGPAQQMLVTADNKGNVKGYIANGKADVPVKSNGHLDVGSFIGKGSLKVIKDMGMKDPYVGISELQTGEVAEDLAYYYFVSEQIPSVVSLGVFLDKDFNIKHAGGYVVQLLPDAEESFIAKLEEKVKAIRSFTELREGGMDLERIAKLIYEDMEDGNYEKLIEEYEILDETEVLYKCDCSKEKFYRGLITLGKNEIEKILAEQKSINVECHFCKTAYDYKKEDFDIFFNVN